MFLILLSLSSSVEAPTSMFLHKYGDSGSNHWRAPAIVKTKDGTIITACDMRGDSIGDLPNPIRIAVRRSTDDGKTFSDTKIVAGTGVDVGYSSPSLVCDKKTGAVLLVFNSGPGFSASTPAKPVRLFYCLSYDSGVSWSEPIEFTDHVYGEGCSDAIRKLWKGVFIVSGGGIQHSTGRIIFTVMVRKQNFGNYPIHTIWTEDLGRTWDVADQSPTIGIESQITELNNGTIFLVTARQPNKTFTYSNDRGMSWNPAWNDDMFVDPGCNAALFRYTSTNNGYDKNRILITHNNNPNSRRAITMRISYDEGNTWKYEKELEPNLAASSTLEIANDGSILLFYEKESSKKSYEMVLMRISLEYVSDGKDTYKAPSREL